MGTHKYETLSSLEVGLRTSLRRSQRRISKDTLVVSDLDQVHNVEFKSVF